MIQRFPQPFNDYNDAESYNPLKTHENPPQNRSAAGFAICAETSEKLDFKRFSGIEKVHRNSIKITVDFWQRTVILIETFKGGATSVQRGVQFSI